jgi:hypothetical protein
MAAKRGKRGHKRKKTPGSARAKQSSRTRAASRRTRKRSPSRTTRSQQARAATDRVGVMVVRDEVSAVTRTETVREHVIDIFVATTGHSSVEGRPLKDLTAKCDDAFRATVAKKVNETWSNLDHSYSSSDIQCSDTVDTLATRVSGDLV